MSARRRREALARDGFVVLPNFYDVEREVAPIREGIRAVVSLLARKHGVACPDGSGLEAMTRGYPALIAANRAWGGRVYDGVKQIPAFMSLVAAHKNAELFAELRPGSVPGLAAGGYGIRIDNPREDCFRADWHQEFPAQLRSVDGLVFWSPLLPVTPDLGPVEIARGSHVEGVIPVFEDPGAAGQQGAYALRLDGLDARLKKYERVAPLSNPGDLLVMDFLTMHRSGENVADHPRWSMQFRYFNFADPTGVALDWRGSFAAGESLAELMPELVVRLGGPT